MKKHIKSAIEKHAMADYPRECCGLVIALGNKEKYIPCRNIADKDTDFKIPADDYAAIEDQGQVLAVVHSHIDRDATPSEVDKVSCEATGLPWHIVSVGQDAGDKSHRVTGWHSFEPIGYVSPLVGREFFHGSLDCYGLVRDFYSREVDIELMDFDRADFWWKDDSAGELYLNNFEKAGFVRVDGEPQFGDVILMQYRSDRTNHGGVYIGDTPLKSQPDLHPIQGALLHHPMPRLSERVIYQGYWRDITRVIVRYVGNGK
ncbi:C40 family peptidase [Vibrio casei]|uniref:Phage tail protein n=1 Tax=Vibrio casei TaxID=673372 RepID=A0A368LII7_9VIBR|nr:C40 family peptidase [Vibrio casei]RCS70183.1 phage tail protein [Vibrio casei]SJN24481.1 Phage tail assembly protein [Vibrio casei]